MPTAIAKKKPSSRSNVAAKQTLSPVLRYQLLQQQNKLKKPASSKRTKITVPPKRTAKELEAENLEWLRKDVGRKFTYWIELHEDETLNDLLIYLRGVENEFQLLNYDDVLVDNLDELCDALSWLESWGPIEESLVDLEQPITVAHRLEELEEDLRNVQELTELLGKIHPVRRLPKWKPRGKKTKS